MTNIGLGITVKSDTRATEWVGQYHQDGAAGGSRRSSCEGRRRQGKRKAGSLYSEEALGFHSGYINGVFVNNAGTAGGE